MNEPSSNAVGWIRVGCQGVMRMLGCNSQFFFFARVGSRLHTARPWLPPGVFKWNEGTIPFLYCHPNRTPWHGKLYSHESANRFRNLALNIQWYGLRSVWSKILIHSNCPEKFAMKFNGMMLVFCDVDVTFPFGVFNGCTACQVCHRQACLPASKWEKQWKDMT